VLRLRVLDYVGNPGGGLRFVSEVVKRLAAAPECSIELVSHGSALHEYRRLLSKVGSLCLLDVAPANVARLNLPRIRGLARVSALLGFLQFHFAVPSEAAAGCDVLWLPWVHRHRLPPESGVPVVGSLHDVTMLEFPELVPTRWRRDEEETLRKWFDSAASIVVTSRATAGVVSRLFGANARRVQVIPVSGERPRPTATEGHVGWPFLDRPYVLCPANTMPHKNHEALFSGAASLAGRHPIVLTGDGTALVRERSGRAAELRERAAVSGLEWDRTIFGLGYVSDAEYHRLVEGAWAVVMPTLAEGGGSFPVADALWSGVPAVASDIPVLREMVERMNGDVLWFDPRDPVSLGGALARLERRYPEARHAAWARVASLRLRGWDDVAREYESLFREASLSRR
jgi:glycosyltransferase involved in cell wall biosynthesis